MTNWNKVKRNMYRTNLPKYLGQEVVYALMRSHGVNERRRKNEPVPVSIHSIYTRRFEAEVEMEIRNALAKSDYWWVKPVLLIEGRVL